jgi:hypothetical protein
MSSQLQVSGEAKIRTIQGPVVANSGVITALDGDASQYVRGDGTLADFPTSTGGGSSVSYYLNSSVSQGTIGGVAYRQLSKTPVIGAGTDITISANGYVANYITDANDPALLEVPGGNFNCEFYFSVNSNNHNPFVYAELYKYDGTNFTLLGSNQAIPDYLSNGTTLSAYYFAIPVAVAALTITDRLAIRIYVNVDGRVVTLHTENNHLCQVVTTFSKGLTSLNNLTRQVQFLATGTSGTDFNISSSTATHTFNIPNASATNRGLITTGTQTIAGNKTFTGENYFSLVNSFDQSINYKTDAVLVGVSGYISQAYAKSGSGASSILSMKIADGSSVKNISLDFIGSAVSTPYSYLFPAFSGTIALLEATQTFTGAKTFSLDILVNSLTIGEGGGSIASNTAIGASALQANTTGDANTAIGYLSMQANTTGYGNTSIGNRALYSNTIGFLNSAVGSNALQNNSTGTYNAALGTSALSNNTTGSNNTAVGWSSGGSNTTGINNTYIGQGAGGGISAGSFNTIIGQYSGTAGLSNNIVLADGQGNVRYQWNGTNNVFGNPISGTSATFSGKLTIGSSSVSEGEIGIFETGGNYNFTTFKNGTVRTIIGSQSSTSQGFIGTASNHDLLLKTNDTTRLTIASTGAATFSSSVTANSNSGGTTMILNGRNNAGVDDNIVSFFKFDGTTLQGRIYARSNILGFRDATNTDVLNIVAGNVGIGTSSPTSNLEIYNNSLSGILRLSRDAGGQRGAVEFGRNNGGSFQTCGSIIVDSDTASVNNGVMYFYTSNSSGTNTERMRITSGGYLKASNNGLYVSTSGTYHELRNTNNDWITISENTNATPFGYLIRYTTASPNGTGNRFIVCADSTTDRFEVRSDGGIANYQTNDVNLSDERTKKDIIPLETYWDKFKAIEIVKFKYKDQTHDDFNIGVIAQQVEKVAPEFVDVDGWGKPKLDEEGNEIASDEIPLKSIYTADLHHATIKVLQECMVKIEELKAEIDELSNKIVALELK